MLAGSNMLVLKHIHVLFVSQGWSLLTMKRECINRCFSRFSLFGDTETSWLGLPLYCESLGQSPSCMLICETSKRVDTQWKEVEHKGKQCDFLEAKFSMCIDSIIHLPLLPNGFCRSWQAVTIQSRSTCYVKTVVLKTLQRKIQLPSRLSWKMIIFVLNNCICLKKLSFLKLG